MNSHLFKSQFNPKDYGQDKTLLACSFLKTGQLLSKMNEYRTPFEKIDLLVLVHKQIKLDINEHILNTKLKQIPLSGDILISSMITAIVNSLLIENIISNMLLIQYFSYVNYSTSEVGNILCDE